MSDIHIILLHLVSIPICLIGYILFGRKISDIDTVMFLSMIFLSIIPVFNIMVVIAILIAYLHSKHIILFKKK